MSLPKITVKFEAAAETLLERVPKRDESGAPLSDLMMLFPGLRGRPRIQITRAIDDIYEILAGFPDDVVFAEFNAKNNVLWVSVRARRGIRAAVAEAIREKVPDAKLISHF